MSIQFKACIIAQAVMLALILLSSFLGLENLTSTLWLGTVVCMGAAFVIHRLDFPPKSKQ